MLFSDITFGIDQGDKIGIIAKNGTGKSTFLRILAQEESPDSGSVVFNNSIRVGYLTQSPQFKIGATVQEIVSQKVDTVHTSWDYEAKMRQLLTQFEITDLSQSVDTLSGGQKKRLALVQLIIQEPDLIILDEPTNHLDIPIIEWLEGYLKRSRATVLLVTHDRYFLDRICNKIVEIDREQFFAYKGNYENYLRRRKERIEVMASELAKVKNTLRREQEWMNRQPQARAGKAKFRIDAFYDLKLRSKINLNEKNVSIDTKSSYIGSKIFEAEGISKKFGDKIIIQDFTYTFARGEHVGLIGPNGVGKSTFIKMLQGLIPADTGNWNVGETVRFGYYSQDGIAFDNNKRVIDAITEIAETIKLKEGLTIAPMQYLQRFLFSPADQQKYIHTLSGGERCRLHLAAVLMTQPNFLILDEPTNDLDIITLGILEEYLSDFKGCVIVVSHDRYFLDNIADHLFVMDGSGEIKDFPGTYSEYREWVDYNNKINSTVNPKKVSSTQTKENRRDRPLKMTFKEKREFEELEKRIESLTEEKLSLEEYFNSGGDDDIREKSARFEKLCEELDMAELRWLELSEKA